MPGAEHSRSASDVKLQSLINTLHSKLNYSYSHGYKLNITRHISKRLRALPKSCNFNPTTGQAFYLIDFAFPFLLCCPICSFVRWFVGYQTASPQTHTLQRKVKRCETHALSTAGRQPQTHASIIPTQTPQVQTLGLPGRFPLMRPLANEPQLLVKKLEVVQHAGASFKSDLHTVL